MSNDSISNVLQKIRQDLLHTTNSVKVLDKMNTKFEQLHSALQSGNDDAINIVRDIARIHGLPNSFGNILKNLILSSTLSDSYVYKVSLTIKYAMKHHHDFTSLRNIITILLKRYPLNDNYSDNATKDFYRQETISNLMLTIVIILDPQRIESESIEESLLLKLETYLGHINGKYKSEIRRCLEKMGYWSGRSDFRGKRKTGNFGGNQLLRTGEQVISDMQKKKGFHVSAHVVKTQQTEQITTEENVSEKTHMSNISLTNALEQGRARTIQAARARENLEPPKSASGSDRCFFKTTSWEVTNFLEKAKGGGAISVDDVKYLSDKFDGFKFSFSESDDAVVSKIAETFYLISKYQKMDATMMEKLLNVVVSDDFEIASSRLYILQAIERYCIRLTSVPNKIYNILKQFRASEKGMEQSDEIQTLIDNLMCSDDSHLSENLKLSISMLKDKSNCIRHLNYIHRQVANKPKKGGKTTFHF